MLVAPTCMQNPVLGLERKPPGLQAQAGAAEPVLKRHVERNVWWCKLLDGAWKGACHPAIGSVFLSVKRDHGQATARGKQTSQGQNTDKLLTLNANDSVGHACRLLFERDETDQSKHDYLPLNKQQACHSGLGADATTDQQGASWSGSMEALGEFWCMLSSISRSFTTQSKSLQDLRSKVTQLGANTGRAVSKLSARVKLRSFLALKCDTCAPRLDSE